VVSFFSRPHIRATCPAHLILLDLVILILCLARSGIGMCKYYLCYNIYTSLSHTPCLTLQICLVRMSENLRDSGHKRANAVLWFLANVLRVLPFAIQQTCNEKSSHITFYNNDTRIFQAVQLPRSVSPLIVAARIQVFPTHKGQTTTEQISVSHTAFRGMYCRCSNVANKGNAWLCICIERGWHMLEK
jgi:hypothetical protein